MPKVDKKLHINTAEALAIHYTVKLINKLKLNNMIIISDSYSNIKSLSKYYLHTLPRNVRADIILGIKKEIKSENRVSKIIWLPSHIGIIEMDEADRLTRLGISDKETDTIGCTQSLIDITMIINYESKKEWDTSLKLNERLQLYIQNTGFQQRSQTKFNSRWKEQT